MSKVYLKSHAIELRKQGMSYKEIRKEIPVSKSTLSLWLKDVPLSEEHKARLYTVKIQNLARGEYSQKERRKREVDEILKKAEAEIKTPISTEAFQLFGAALYWAEGRKTNGLEFTNSDPNMIAIMVQWFETIFGVLPSQLKAHLNIYSQQNESDLKKFWAEVTGIPLERFGKSFIKPENKGYKKNTLYYGTIKIYVPKGTNLRYRINGWIRKILHGQKNRIESLQVRWQSLRETPRPVNILDAPIA